MIIKEMPLDQRPREKMMRQGKEALTNGELLGILIGTGTKDKTSVALADDILSMDTEGIRFLNQCTLEELSSLRGIGMAKACQIVAAVELGRRMATLPSEKRKKIKATKDVVELFMERMRNYKREHLEVLMLDAKGNIIAIENVAIGDVSSSIVHPRETFRSAIKRSAYAIILVHNHPSGDPSPSQEDIDVTKRLATVGQMVGIKVLDHVIIGDGTYTSICGMGII